MTGTLSIEAAKVLLMETNFLLNDSATSISSVINSFLSFLITKLEFFVALPVILFSSL